MSANEILNLIDAEIAKLQQARTLLAGATKKGPGGPLKSSAAPVAKPKQEHKFSPEGRARLVAAVKARWAAKK
jgi:hypothetical protein